MSLVNHFPATTTSQQLIDLRPAARSLILGNESGSAGSATFSAVGQDGTSLFAAQVLTPGQSVTVNLVNKSANEAGTALLMVVAASTAFVSAHSVPL